MSDTPRTDAAYFERGATMYSLAGEMKQLERENDALRKSLRQIRASERKMGLETSAQLHCKCVEFASQTLKKWPAKKEQP